MRNPSPFSHVNNELRHSVPAGIVKQSLLNYKSKAEITKFLKIVISFLYITQKHIASYGARPNEAHAPGGACSGVSLKP